MLTKTQQYDRKWIPDALMNTRTAEQEQDSLDEYIAQCCAMHVSDTLKKPKGSAKEEPEVGRGSWHPLAKWKGKGR